MLVWTGIAWESLSESFSVWNGSSWINDTPIAPLSMTVEGTSFQPTLELAAESSASVSWMDSEGEVLSVELSPSITFLDAGPHTVYLLVSEPSEVVTLNLGFHEGQDDGLYSLPSSYRKATQPVVAIEGLQYLSGLQRFMAARTSGSSASPTSYSGPRLGGALDFSGMSNLEYIECYSNNITSVNLTGCSSLIRLCVERTAVSTLDLNAMRSTLRDLRAAYLQGGSLTLVPLEGPLSVLYHFCVRRQNLINMPIMANLPAVQQLWIWETGQTIGTLAPRTTASGGMDSIRLYRGDEGETGTFPMTVETIDVDGVSWSRLESDPTRLWLRGVDLQAVVLDEVEAIEDIDLSLNPDLSSATIDYVIITVEGWGTSNGTLNLSGTSVPTSASASARSALISRGWTLTYDAPAAPSIVTTGLTLAQGVPVNLTLTVTGEAPITWAVTAGTLPDGLDLSIAGVLTGTPVEAGAYDFTVTATNAYGSDIQQYVGSVESDGGPTPLWADEFETPGVGWANSGGWQPGAGQSDTDVEIAGGQLIWTGAIAYRHALNPNNGILPADLEVELGFTRTVENEGPGNGFYWGLAARVNPANNTGARIFFIGAANTVRVGDSSTSGGATVTVSLPAGWGNVGPHTFSIRCVGAAITALCDGVEIVTRDVNVNTTLVGGAVGIVGETQGRAWDYIRVYEL